MGVSQNRVIICKFPQKYLLGLYQITLNWIWYGEDLSQEPVGGWQAVSFDGALLWPGRRRGPPLSGGCEPQDRGLLLSSPSGSHLPGQRGCHPLLGEVEVDESYFGGRRKGLRGRGAAGKVPVFGLLKRGGKVYAKMISDIKSSTLQAIME